MSCVPQRLQYFVFWVSALPHVWQYMAIEPLLRETRPAGLVWFRVKLASTSIALLSGDTSVSQEIGQIKSIFRYPVKSMAGVQLDRAMLGWHGLNGDRRFGFRRLADQSGFPWLTASRLPELILYKPTGASEVNQDLPTHVRTPDGAELALHSEELQNEISRRHGAPLQLMQLKHGIFDDATVSLINAATVREIEREAGRAVDVLRFRPNILIESNSNEPFAEDQWVGKTLRFGSDDTRFGSDDNAPAVSITMRDLRCVMINLDPETAEADANVMKTTLRLNTNHAGVYATVISSGELRVDQKVYLV